MTRGQAAAQSQYARTHAKAIAPSCINADRCRAGAAVASPELLTTPHRRSFTPGTTPFGLAASVSALSISTYGGEAHAVTDTTGREESSSHTFIMTPSVALRSLAGVKAALLPATPRTCFKVMRASATMLASVSPGRTVSRLQLRVSGSSCSWADEPCLAAWG